MKHIPSPEELQNCATGAVSFFGGAPCGRVKMEPFGIFPCFVVFFGQFEANICDEAMCDLVGFPCFIGIPAANLTKTGKKCQKDKWFHLHACTGAPTMEHPELVTKVLTSEKASCP